MFTSTWIKEKELQLKVKKKIKQGRPILLEENENENSIAAVSKMRNTSGHQRENE